MIFLFLIFFMGIQSVMATSDLSDDFDYDLADSIDSSIGIGSSVSMDSSKSPDSGFSLDSSICPDSKVSDDDLSSSDFNTDTSYESNDGTGFDSDFNSNDDAISSSDLDKAEDSRYIHYSAKNKLSSNYLESYDFGSTEFEAVSVSNLITIKSADNYVSLSEDIQKIINSASAGSTIQFIGTFYEDLYLKIDKPLNIISKCGTVINNTQNIPVFDLNSKATGTNITGFTVNLVGSFVEATGVSKISISCNTIRTTKTAIVLSNVEDSKIENNNLLRFKTGIDISRSGGITISKNKITPNIENSIGVKLTDITSKKGIKILDNNITGWAMTFPAYGIYADNVKNLYMKGNVLSKLRVGMEVPDSLSNFTIHNNTFSLNRDGLVISGWVNDFTFTKNTVVDNDH
jgi:parallel beta-helix repeat protein